MCGGLAATANWISNLIITQTFISLIHALGTSLTFLLFGGISALALMFVVFWVPETKGLSFEEVKDTWRKRAGNHKQETEARTEV